MMLSELLNELEKIYAQHGNVRVAMRNMDWNTLVTFKLVHKKDTCLLIVEPE